MAWTSLIVVYAQHGFVDEGVKCFKKMCDERIVPIAISFFSILNACGSLRGLQMGKQIHLEVRKRGLLCLSCKQNVASWKKHKKYSKHTRRIKSLEMNVFKSVNVVYS